MKITKLTQSNDTKVFFKLALGKTGEDKRYSKILTKDIFNKISQSLKEIRVYLNIQSNKENNYKTLSYEWLNIENIEKNDDIQKELFVYASNMFRENKSQYKDNVNITIHIDKLPKSISNLIVWQDTDTTNDKSSSDDDISPF